MNFISELKAQDIELELKYCERCGGLWLRTRGEEAVYCPGCTARLAALPRPGRRQGKKASECLVCGVKIENIRAVATMEVEA